MLLGTDKSPKLTMTQGFVVISILVNSVYWINGSTRATSSQISYRIYSIISRSTASTPSKGCVDSAVMKPLFCPIAISLAVAIKFHLWRLFYMIVSCSTFQCRLQELWDIYSEEIVVFRSIRLLSNDCSRNPHHQVHVIASLLWSKHCQWYWYPALWCL